MDNPKPGNNNVVERTEVRYTEGGRSMKNYVSVVEKYRSLILDAERYVWQHPETGYREVKTAEYLAKKFEELGYTLTYAGDIPGFYTVFDTGRPGPEVLVLGEMVSLI